MSDAHPLTAKRQLLFLIENLYEDVRSIERREVTEIYKLADAIEAAARSRVVDEIRARIQYQATTLRTHEAKGVISVILADLSGLARDTEDGQPNGKRPSSFSVDKTEPKLGAVPPSHPIRTEVLAAHRNGEHSDSVDMECWFCVKKWDELKTMICAERRENPKHLRIGITNRMILGGMSGPDAKRLIDEYDAACARNDQ